MQIRMCHDVVVPLEMRARAARAALLENPANAAPPVAMAQFGAAPEVATPLAAVMLTGKRWKPGRTITISFLDGDYALHKRVRYYMNKWLDCANLKFRWISGHSDAGEVRITFARGGSWSFLGTDALVIPRPRPTMQFGWIDAGSPAEEIRRVVIHEGGHMLALGHEHSHPEGGIPWDKEAVYAYYARTNGWSRAEVDAQVFQRYSASQTQYSRYDPKSIMHYAVDDALTLGRYSVGWNTKRSPTDRRFVRSQYPFAGASGQTTRVSRLIKAALGRE